MPRCGHHPGHVVRVDLIDNDSAYQRLAPGALDAGIRSVLSVPLYDSDRVIGSLNVYSASPHVFEGASERAAAPFAEMAAAVIAASPVLPAAIGLVEDVVEAMEEGAMLEQAVGVVMARRACTMPAARRVLVSLETVFGSARAVSEAVLRDPSVAKVARE